MKLSLDTPEQLSELAYAQGWLPRSVSVTRLTIAGPGNMNCVLRGHLSSDDSLIFKQSLPWVAKYPDIPAPVERLDVEAAFFSALRDQTALVARMPRILGYAEEERILCMQDLGAGQDFTGLYATSTADLVRWVDALSGLAEWLAALHRVAVDDPEAFTNRSMRRLNHEHIFVLPLTQDIGPTPAIGQAVSELRQDATLRAAAERLGKIYLGNLETSAACLLHGDFYPGSWLQTSKSAMVIDPEFGFFGPPEFDVGVMLAHLQFAGFDASARASILSGYRPIEAFQPALADAFAAIEVIRRLLGVARLPLEASPETLSHWLIRARDTLVAWHNAC